MEKVADITEIAEMPMLEEMLVVDDAPMDSVVIVDEPKAEEDFDWDKNKDLKKFLHYLQSKMGKIPPHSGKTTAGCERAIAYLKTLDKEISKAISEDTDCHIDDQSVETLRKDIRKMVKKLQKRHNEINDAYDADDEKYATDSNEKIIKASDCWVCPECKREIRPPDEEHITRHKAMEHGHAVDDKIASDCSCKVQKHAAPEDENCPKCKIKLWKAAEGLYECISCDDVFEKQITKEAHTARLTLVMTPFERAITGMIVNGFVSNGKNPEVIYAELKKKYKFSDRDELSIHQILYDMGYPILKDRGHLGDPSEKLNKGEGIEFATQYTA